MKATLWLLLIAGLSGLLTQSLLALEVDREVLPRMTLGGRVIATLDAAELDSEVDNQEEINLADSLLLLRFDKRLYGEKGIAGAVVGLNEHDEEMRFHQLHTFYWNQDLQLRLGRTRLPNFIIEFPTLRDDDLANYTHVGNASSHEEFDQIYGELLSLDWFPDNRFQTLNLWTGTRHNGHDLDAPDGLDSYGVGYQYAQPEHVHFFERLRLAGIKIDRQKVNTGNDNEWITAALAGIEFNLNRDPSKNWSMGIQGLFQEGIDGLITGLSNVANQARAESYSLVTALRYTHRPNLLTRWQAGLTLAYKDYTDNDAATQWTIVPSFIYRLGHGIDLLTQLSYKDYDSGLYEGGNDLIFQVGMAFSLESVLNDQIGERDSILNLEHSYIQ